MAIFRLNPACCEIIFKKTLIFEFEVKRAFLVRVAFLIIQNVIILNRAFSKNIFIKPETKAKKSS